MDAVIQSLPEYWEGFRTTIALAFISAAIALVLPLATAAPADAPSASPPTAVTTTTPTGVKSGSAGSSRRSRVARPSTAPGWWPSR